MWTQWLMAGGTFGLVAESSKALITWTPVTFYVACALVQTLVIWLGYRLLGADPEYNNFWSALIAASLANLAAYGMKDLGVIGAIGTFGVYFFTLIITSGVAIFRSIVVFVLVMLTYWGVGTFVANRTPLTAYDMGGVPKVEMTGGFEEEPVQRQKPDDKNDSLPDK